MATWKKRIRERPTWVMPAGIGLLLLVAMRGWTAEIVPAPALSDDTKTTRTMSVAIPNLTAPTDLQWAPVATFAAKCVRCHGAEGVKYKPSVWMRNGSSLRRQVTAMMTRRARLEPKPAEIEAMGAYVRSLKGGLFVGIANGAEVATGKPGRPVRLTGEATPGARAFLIKNGMESPLTPTKEGAWVAEGATQPPFVIRAVKGSLTAEFTFPGKQWAFVANPEHALPASADAANSSPNKPDALPEPAERDDRRGDR